VVTIYTPKTKQTKIDKSIPSRPVHSSYTELPFLEKKMSSNSKIRKFFTVEQKDLDDSEQPHPEKRRKIYRHKVTDAKGLQELIQKGTTRIIQEKIDEGMGFVEIFKTVFDSIPDHGKPEFKKAVPSDHARCACGCPGVFCNKEDDEKINEESLEKHPKCGHFFHESCYKICTVYNRMTHHGSSYGFENLDQPVDWTFCPICDHERPLDSKTRCKIWQNHEQVWHKMIWPIPFGTVVVRPYIPVEELDQVKDLFLPGEVVDCGGYRNRDAWIMMPDKTWKQLDSGEDEYVTEIPQEAYDAFPRDKQEYYGTLVPGYFGVLKSYILGHGKLLKNTNYSDSEDEE